MKKLKSILGIMIFAIMIISLNGNAFAVPCSLGSVSGSVKCQDGLANNDQFNPLTVNTEKFFGYDDWIWLEKDDEGTKETNFNAEWTVTPDGGWASDTGEWSFSSLVWTTFEDVMIVVKNGNNTDNDIETYFSGYLLDNVLQPTSGTWDTGDKDLSHLTLYARGETPIPEPGTLLLLGTGLMGVAALGRKKFRK